MNGNGASNDHGVDLEEVRRETESACSDLLGALKDNPALVESISLTLEDLVRGWTTFILNVVEYHERRRSREEMPEIIDPLFGNLEHLFSSIYNERVGAALASLVNTTYTVLLPVLSRCGDESPQWVNLRSSLAVANMVVSGFKLYLMNRYFGPEE